MRALLLLPILWLLPAQDAPEVKRAVGGDIEAIRALVGKRDRTLARLYAARDAARDPEAQVRLRNVVRQLEAATLGSKLRIETGVATGHFGGPPTPDLLEGKIVTIRELDADLATALRQLGRQMDLPIIPTFREERDAEFEEFELASLASILDHFCSAEMLAWRITEDGIIVVGDPPPAVGRLHRIQTLTQTFRDTSVAYGLLPDEIPSIPRIPPPEPIISGDDILTLIQENVDVDVWENSDRYMMNMTPGGDLDIQAPLKTHARVTAYLDGLRPLAMREGRSKIELFAATRVPFEGEMTAEGYARLRREATRMASFELAARSGVSIGSESGTRVQWIQGYDPDDGSPDVGEIFSGFKAAVRSSPTADRRFVTADVKVYATRVISMDTVETGKGPVHLPRVERNVVTTTVTVPTGRPVLLGWTEDATGDAERPVLLVVGTFNSGP